MGAHARAARAPARNTAGFRLSSSVRLSLCERFRDRRTLTATSTGRRGRSRSLSRPHSSDSQQQKRKYQPVWAEATAAMTSHLGDVMSSTLTSQQRTAGYQPVYVRAQIRSRKRVKMLSSFARCDRGNPASTFPVRSDACDGALTAIQSLLDLCRISL